MNCYGFLVEDMLEDLSQALAFVQNGTAWGIDPDRIYLTGESAGGHLALLMAYTFNNSAIRGVLTLYPVTSIPSAFPCEASGSAVSVKALIGSCAESDTGPWDPVNRVHGQVPPTITVHGTEDTSAPFEDSQRFHDLLDSVGATNYFLPVEAAIIVTIMAVIQFWPSSTVLHLRDWYHWIPQGAATMEVASAGVWPCYTSSFVFLSC